MEVGGGDNWTTGAISRAKLQSNHHHQQTDIQLFTGRMTFLSPNQQCQSTEGKISHSMGLLTSSSPGVFQFCLWPLITPGYIEGGLPCLSSALWCNYYSCWHGILHRIPSVAYRVILLTDRHTDRLEGNPQQFTEVYNPSFNITKDYRWNHCQQDCYLMKGNTGSICPFCHATMYLQHVTKHYRNMDCLRG